MKFAKPLVLSGVMFGAALGAWLWLIGRPHAIELGAGSGLLFGLAIATVANRVEAKLAAVQAVLLPGATVVKSGGANRGAAGGWLFLTSDELVFKPHSMNLDSALWRIWLRDVQGAKAVRSAGVIPNGLLVTTQQGPMRFVVSGNRAWAAALTTALRRP